MKQTIKPYPLIHPTTIVLIGTIYCDKANYTTIGDIAVAGLNPPLVMVSLHKNHEATKYIETHKRFSINSTSSSMMKEVDYCGIHSASSKDKSSLFKSSIIDELPIIDTSPINMIVDVVNSITVEQRVIYVCKVDKTFIDNDLIKNDSLILNKIKPLLYGLDNSYYSGINKIGTGYKEGSTIPE